MRALCLLLGLLAALPVQAGTSLRKGRFKQEYRQALDFLARGDRSGALDAVLDLEAVTVETAGPETIRRMRQLEIEVLEDLLPAGIDVLVPVTLVHEQAYLRHRRADRPLLALHARTLVVDLARFYAQAGGSAARPMASGLLTSLAGHLQEASIDSVAAGLYDEALKLDSDNAAALLALAYLREQRGDYARALPLLERLMALQPDNGEALLRLGVNRLRIGRIDAGIEALERVLASSQPTWIRSLAYQELGRSLADRNALESARRLLGRAVDELPDDPSLAIQLAFLADLDGGSSEDLQDLLERSAGRVMVAPRYRYSRMPAAAIDEVRRQIAGREAQRLFVLTRALSGEHGQRAGR
jgi:tetratricopeptide (TPR) repeat protein